MWISLFLIATATAIGLSVTAVVLQGLNREAPVRSQEFFG